MLHETLLEDARAIAGDIVSLRRAIHAEPELGLDTPKTRDKGRAALADLPLTWQESRTTSGLGAGTPGPLTSAGRGGAAMLAPAGPSPPTRPSPAPTITIARFIAGAYVRARESMHHGAGADSLNSVPR